nr:piggyBac transposable element-derived protein 3-like [Leptinotarsa decemlineata]
MSRRRFDNILSNLHINDNAKIPVNNKDKLYKLKPMIDSLNETFNAFSKGTRHITIDESMIAFKDRSSIKQYNPMRPIKRGYKIWCCDDQKGYILHFDIHQGKEGNDNEPELTDWGLGEKVVLELLKNYLGTNRIIVFDKFFTSVPLLEKLKVEKTYAWGTIRCNRKGTPKNLTNDKNLKRGEFDYRFSTAEIGFFRWRDNRVVNLASNFHGNETTVVKRKQKDGTSIEIPCPTIVADYNKYMGGVDKAHRRCICNCICVIL